MNQSKIYQILKKKFKTPFIKNLPNILNDFYLLYPNQLKGIVFQKYKQNKLIDYVVNQACNHHDRLPLEDKVVRKYVYEYMTKHQGAKLC